MRSYRVLVLIDFFWLYCVRSIVHFSVLTLHLRK